MPDTFKALADPTRRAILLKVAEEPTNVNAIAENFDMSRPAVSKHIKILEDSELIAIEADPQDGRQRNCYAQLEALAEINNYLSELNQFWDKRLNKLAQYLDNTNNNK